MKHTTLILTITLIYSLVAEAQAQTPRIDLGNRFEARIQNSVERSGKTPKGTATFVFAFHVENASNDTIQVHISQRKRTIDIVDCEPKKPKYATRCQSRAIASKSLDVRKPVEIRYVHQDDATDEQTELLALQLPLSRTRDWVGMKGRKPMHVEQRHLMHDGALGLFLLEDGADGASVTRTDKAYMRAWFWDARTENDRAKWSLRCRIDGGAWHGYKIGKPSPSAGPDIAIQNRVYQRKQRGAETQELRYQRFSFNLEMPFSAFGSRALDSPREVDGTWQCQLRATNGAKKRIVRDIHFSVEGNVAQPHAAQSSLYFGPKRIATTVDFSAVEGLISANPGQVGTIYGVVAARGKGLTRGSLPRKSTAPRFRR